MDTNNIDAVPKSQEEIIFEDMSNGLDQIRATRETMIAQLGQVVANTKINFEEDAPRKTEMKLTLFKTVDDLLKSQESLLTGKTKLSLQKKSEASSDAVKLMAVEILKNIDMKQKKNMAVPVATNDTDNEALRQVFKTMTDENPDTAIKEDELVMDEAEAK